MAGIKKIVVDDLQRQVAELKAALAAQTGTRTQASAKPKKKSAKKPTASAFVKAASATPIKSGKGKAYTITLGDVVLNCNEQTRGIIKTTATLGSQTRHLVFRPSTNSAMQSGAYIASVLRGKGLFA